MRSRKPFLACLFPALAFPWLAGCAPAVLPFLAPPPAPVSVAASSSPAHSRPPIIAAFDYSPKSTLGKDDLVTFTVVATDPGGQPLQYTWTATKGRLTSNTGAATAWAPVRTDGNLDVGLATVTVTVSNGSQTQSGSINLQISPSGSVTAAGTS